MMVRHSMDQKKQEDAAGYQTISDTARGFPFALKPSLK
jgi:hypothetical protein